MRYKIEQHPEGYWTLKIDEKFRGNFDSYGEALSEAEESCMWEETAEKGGEA